LTQIRRLRVLAVLSLLGMAAVVLLRVFDPATSGVFPPCPLHYLTGFYCPGCGSLRAIHALLHGDLRQAWAMNALTVMLLPFIAYGLASALHFQLRGRALPGPMLPAAWIRALCVAIILFGIARNLPLHPFDLLAPGTMLRLG
jgi:Protein of unknown function (DUF2752)